MKRATVLITPEQIKKYLLGLELTDSEVIIVKHDTDPDGNLILDCVIVGE